MPHYSKFNFCFKTGVSMIFACLFLLLTSSLVTPAYHTRSRSSGKNTDVIVPITVSRNISSDSSFKDSCYQLRKEIQEFAMKKLKRKGPISQFHFSDYEITNWPPFVPYNPKNWDEQALVELRTALPRMVFKKKPKGYDFMNERIKNRRLILDLLLERYKEHTHSPDVTRVSWSNVHLKGWPCNVSLRADHWNVDEVLAIYRHLDRIFFETIMPGDVRTVTYIDGSVEQQIPFSGSKRKIGGYSYDSEDEEFEEGMEERSEENDSEERQDPNSLESVSARVNMSRLTFNETEKVAGFSSAAELDSFAFNLGNEDEISPSSTNVSESEEESPESVTVDDCEEEPSTSVIDFDSYLNYLMEKQEDHESLAHESSSSSDETSENGESTDIEEFLAKYLSNYDPDGDNSLL